eukprot:TRINITY_DN22559_c0_g1_i1.p1 TRINITY_DN22559_c0_g1~~TRINITY_DN22559_c0_g1_i1.p1  ORF type:complete len:371 (-),score=50.29 TRINITY_DN22559_c0_g1_i1:43-1155(-)
MVSPTGPSYMCATSSATTSLACSTFVPRRYGLGQRWRRVVADWPSIGLPSGNLRMDRFSRRFKSLAPLKMSMLVLLFATSWCKRDSASALSAGMHAVSSRREESIGRPRPNQRYLDHQQRKCRDPLEVLFEDEQMLVINKAAGVLAQADEKGGDSLCVQARHYLKQTSADPFVGLIHRLDRDVTGISVLAKSSLAAKWVSEQFASRNVQKEYIAVVRKWSSSGSLLLRSVMQVDETGQASEAELGTPGAQQASLECRRLCAGPSGVTALLVRLHTGRRHQIRFQLSSVGSPLLGDRRYGRGSRDGSRKWIQRPALHAWRLRFLHPSEPHDMCEVVAPLPSDLAALLSAVGMQPDQVLAEASLGIDDTAIS